MLVTFTILGLIFFDIVFQPLFHLWQGGTFILPVLILASGAYGRWYAWSLFIFALCAAAFFVPVSPLFLIGVMAISYGMHFIFTEWINETWLKFALLSLVISIATVISSLVYHQGLSLHIIGSIILSVSVLGVWFSFFTQKKPL